MDEILQFGLAPDAAAVALKWLSSLKSERRMAAKTLEAYAHDLSQFGGFLAEHLGEVANVRALEELTASDFRSFMAKRRGAGIQSRSLARQMSAIRSFFRFAERGGIFKCASLSVVRAPKISHSIPRPLPEVSARLVAEADVFEQAEPWVQARCRTICEPSEHCLSQGWSLRACAQHWLARRQAPFRIGRSASW